MLPAEARVRERVVDAARDAFARYGYGAIVTPTFEETEVFVRGVGTSTDVVRKEMYTFEDRGGRSLTLRPEGTAPVVRAFVQHGMYKLPLPVKLWYLAPMFRYEAPQSGRYREHWQLGAEAIGSADPLLDAEVIALLDGILRRLGVPGLRLRDRQHGDAESRGPYRDLLVEFWSATATPSTRRRSPCATTRCASSTPGPGGGGGHARRPDAARPTCRRPPARTARPCSAPSTAWGSRTRRTRRWCAASTTTR